MGRDRSEEERLVDLRRRIANSTLGAWLSPKKIDAIARAIDRLQTAHDCASDLDNQEIDDLCDLLKPYLTTTIYGRAYYDCPKERYHRGRRVVRDNRSNETSYDYIDDCSD
jgi:hypothetical protein